LFLTTKQAAYPVYFCLRFMPWEEARRERILRLEIVVALVDSGVIWDDRAVYIWGYHARLWSSEGLGSGGLRDNIWGNTALDGKRIKLH